MTSRRQSRAGITLIEMMVVVAIIAVIAGISFPSVTAGLDTLRLAQTTDGIATFFNTALTYAEKRQQVMEIVISASEKKLSAHSADSAWTRSFALPPGITVERVLPEAAADSAGARSFFVYPGGSVPRMGVEVASARGAVRTVRVDPISGVAQVERTR